ncbi:MAG: fatty acid desaturase [Candidatus Doudnabacteria bacterium]|nr:fatty acid desaturase [Candidatus Doudnabacteria bacterium]
MLAFTVAIAMIPLVAAVMATTVYLHRCRTHRSLELAPRTDWSFRLVIWMTTGIDVAEWVAVHRKHHAHTDVIGDPHSPLLEGLPQIEFGNVFYYAREARNKNTVEKFARDILDGQDWWDKHVFCHQKSGLALGIALLCLILGWWGLIAAAIHAMAYVFILTPAINGLCHYPHPLGYQHTAEPHARTTFNNFVVAVLTCGEGLHHNHHWHQHSARLAHTRLEVLADAGWWVIWVLEKAGLACNVKTLPLAG